MSELPGTAAAGGSDDGDAGGRRVEPQLSEDDGRLLRELRRAGPPVVEAREDRPLTAAAVEDDRPVPAPGGPGRLDVVFQEPPATDA